MPVFARAQLPEVLRSPDVSIRLNVLGCEVGEELKLDTAHGCLSDRYVEEDDGTTIHTCTVQLRSRRRRHVDPSAGEWRRCALYAICAQFSHSSLDPDAMFGRTCLPRGPTLAHLARGAAVPRIQYAARVASMPYTTSVPRARRDQPCVPCVLTQ